MTTIPNPCYVIEESLLRRNLALIKNVSEQAGVEIILAFKAFALWKSFPIFREYIEHTTASSLYEAKLAYEEFGSTAHTYSPAYIDEEFDEIARCSSHITFNSFNQLRHFAPVAMTHGVSCGIRVNPEYSEIETDLYNPCAPGSRFGILRENLDKYLSDNNETLASLGVEGFHIHCHCESGSDVFARTLTHIESKFGDLMSELKWINFGGGHLMTRKDYDIPLLIDTLKVFKQRHPNLRVILEPGSAFAWQTGPLYSKVVDIVENHGIKTAILNVSFTCHMPDCLEMPYHPVVRGAEIIDEETLRDESVLKNQSGGNHLYRLGGNSCLSGDYMEYWRFDHELQIGEEIIFEDMIHYTTVKTCMFNGINHPSIGILHSDGTFELYREYHYEDYRDRMC